MNTSEALTRAILYRRFRNCPTLRTLKFQELDNDSLRMVLNENNSLYMQKLPIILSKVAAKFILQILIKRVPTLGFMKPDKIKIQIESNEYDYLSRKQATTEPNIVLIVATNIIFPVLGSQLEEFTNNLVNEEQVNDPENLIEVQNINSKLDTKSPTQTYSNLFESDLELNPKKSLKRSVTRSRLDSGSIRSLSTKSTISNKSTSSFKDEPIEKTTITVDEINEANIDMNVSEDDEIMNEKSDDNEILMNEKSNDSENDLFVKNNDETMNDSSLKSSDESEPEIDIKPIKMKRNAPSFTELIQASTSKNDTNLSNIFTIE